MLDVPRIWKKKKDEIRSLLLEESLLVVGTNGGIVCGRTDENARVPSALAKSDERETTVESSLVSGKNLITCVVSS